MKISLEHIGKKFQRYWIFKDITYNFSAPGSYAMLGPNGSGKSTLLRLVGGMQNPSKGTVVHELEGRSIADEGIFEHISYCAPGMEIIEELTLREYLDFHFNFKKLLPGLSVSNIIETIGLREAADKPVGDYSSGMKQRVKLAQAIFADTPALLLDEPCTNLDQAGVNQYLEWMDQYSRQRLIIVASNDEREYSFCKEQIRVEDFK